MNIEQTKRDVDALFDVMSAGLAEGGLVLPALSLWRPWAGWVAGGRKTIETRLHSRWHALAGKWIAIHAAQRWDSAAVALANEVIPPWEDYLPARREDHAAGCVVAVAHVREARWLTAADSLLALIDCSNTRRFGFLLDRVLRLVTPVPAKGFQSVWRWTVPDELHPQLLEHMAGGAA